MGKMSKNISWEISRKAFLPVLILIFVIVFYVFYNILFSSKISVQVHQSVRKGIVPIFIVSIAFIIQRVAGGAFSFINKAKR